MTDDDYFASPNRKPRPSAVSKPGEPLFEFYHNHALYQVELRDHGQWGIEAQFFKRGEFLYSHRFNTRRLAVAWAEGTRKIIERGWEL
jgi:hypothetical protein